MNIGNNVEILAGAQIISNKRGKGRLNIGDEARCCSNSCIDDVPENAFVAGVLPRIIGYRDIGDNWVNYLKDKRAEDVT